MTLPELLAKMPSSLQTQGQLYGPVVAKMTADDIAAWLQYVFVGKYGDAFALYLKAKGDTDTLSDWDTEHASWVKDNQGNADKIALSNKIGLAMAQAMIGVMLTAVGL
jgi:hypothetical protein